MDTYSPNELAYLDLINDISKAFCFVGEDWEPAISVSYTHLTLPTSDLV